MSRFLMRRTHFILRVAALAACLGCAIVLGADLLGADEPPATPSATSSNLSSALPPEEWTRVERSIDRGLQWLASQQADDGSFPSNPVGQPAVTSLAVMAFLSRGHLPGHGVYGRQIDRAIEYVLAQQDRRGYFSALRVTPTPGHLKPPQTVHYNHSIAGLMLGEVYGMTSGPQSRRVETALSKALAYSRSIQAVGKAHPDEAGGWRYAYQNGGLGKANSDLSVSGWALMFYRSARNAEFAVPKQYVDEGLDFVERCYVDDPADRKDGVFRYRPLSVQKEAKPTLANTGSAMLVLTLGGRHDSEMVRQGARWYASRNYPEASKTGHFYLASYYSSQAMAQVGGEVWNRVYPQDRRRADERANAGRRLAAGRRQRGIVRLDLLHVSGGAGPDAALSALPIYQRDGRVGTDGLRLPECRPSTTQPILN